MKRRCLYYPLFILLACAGSFAASSQKRNSLIEQAVAEHIKNHPATTYQDLYKSFFQDRFGPGHLLADTARARAYLLRELTDTSRFAGPDFEPTGSCGRYVRVNLRLIKEGQVDIESFFRAFIESIPQEATDTESWKEQWTALDSIVAPLCVGLPEGELTRADILKQIERGDPVVHHSRALSSSGYHYRIIAAPLARKLIAH